MERRKRTKTNTTFFEDIPKKVSKKEIEQKLLKLYMDRASIKQKLSDINQEKMKWRESLYNATLDMNKVDSKIDQWQSKYVEKINNKEE